MATVHKVRKLTGPAPVRRHGVKSTWARWVDRFFVTFGVLVVAVAVVSYFASIYLDLVQR